MRFQSLVILSVLEKSKGKRLNRAENIKLRKEALTLAEQVKLSVQVDFAKALGDNEELMWLIAEAKAVD
jgi:hypothetical protein